MNILSIPFLAVSLAAGNTGTWLNPDYSTVGVGTDLQSFDLSGDGKTLVAVFQTKVDVYYDSGSGFSLQSTLVPSTTFIWLKDVAVTDDGNRVAVQGIWQQAANYVWQGTITVFDRIGNTWSETNTTDLSPYNDPQNFINVHAGRSVRLSSTGHRMAYLSQGDASNKWYINILEQDQGGTWIALDQHYVGNGYRAYTDDACSVVTVGCPSQHTTVGATTYYYSGTVDVSKEVNGVWEQHVIENPVPKQDRRYGFSAEVTPDGSLIYVADVGPGAGNNPVPGSIDIYDAAALTLQSSLDSPADVTMDMYGQHVAVDTSGSTVISSATPYYMATDRRSFIHVAENGQQVAALDGYPLGITGFDGELISSDDVNVLATTSPDLPDQIIIIRVGEEAEVVPIDPSLFAAVEYSMWYDESDGTYVGVGSSMFGDPDRRTININDTMFLDVDFTGAAGLPYAGTYNGVVFFTERDNSNQTKTILRADTNTGLISWYAPTMPGSSSFIENPYARLDYSAEAQGMVWRNNDRYYTMDNEGNCLSAVEPTGPSYTSASGSVFNRMEVKRRGQFAFVGGETASAAFDYSSELGDTSYYGFIVAKVDLTDLSTVASEPHRQINVNIPGDGGYAWDARFAVSDTNVLVAVGSDGFMHLRLYDLDLNLIRKRTVAHTNPAYNNDVEGLSPAADCFLMDYGRTLVDLDLNIYHAADGAYKRFDGQYTHYDWLDAAYMTKMGAGPVYYNRFLNDAETAYVFQLGWDASATKADFDVTIGLTVDSDFTDTAEPAWQELGSSAGLNSATPVDLDFTAAVYEETRTEVMPIASYTAPQDSGSIIASDGGVDWYGELAASDLITGPDLAELVGVTAGQTVGNSMDNAGWLHVGIDGKELYIAKRPIRYYLRYSALVSANVVDGSRTVVIKGQAYKIRLIQIMTGTSLSGAYDHPSTHGSEWNRIMYRLSAGDKYAFDPVFTSEEPFTRLAQYSLFDLWAHYRCANGYRTMGQIGGSVVPAAGAYNVSRVDPFTASSSSSQLGWRPVLEKI